MSSASENRMAVAMAVVAGAPGGGAVSRVGRYGGGGGEVVKRDRGVGLEQSWEARDWG